MIDLNEALLTPQQRERRNLGYLALGPTFGVNYLTAMHGPENDEGAGPGPRVTFFAQPTELANALDLAKLPAWLDPNLRKYEPAPGTAFVPQYTRGIVDGVVAQSRGEPQQRSDRFLAVRRSGSVEYGAYCSWLHRGRGQRSWLLHETQVILQFAQFLRFLDDFASTFERPKWWTVWCNVRDVKAAVLMGFGEGWAEPGEFNFRSIPCLEDQFQLELHFTGGAEATDDLVAELAIRFELAFGFTTPRAYDRAGPAIGSINFARVRYE